MYLLLLLLYREGMAQLSKERYLFLLLTKWSSRLWKKQRSMFKQLIPSGVWKGIEETQSSVEIQVFDRRGVCPYCIERGRSPEFLYLAILLVVFSRAAQTIAWIWMSRRAHPSFYFLRCNWKRSHVCQKLCPDNTVHPLVPSCVFSPFKYIFLFEERILKIISSKLLKRNTS